jgi:hypothetical protein
VTPTAEIEMTEPGDERVQSLSASGMAGQPAPVKPGESRPYLRLDPGSVTQPTERLQEA